MTYKIVTVRGNELDAVARELEKTVSKLIDQSYKPVGAAELVSYNPGIKQDQFAMVQTMIKE